VVAQAAKRARAGARSSLQAPVAGSTFIAARSDVGGLPGERRDVPEEAVEEPAVHLDHGAPGADRGRAQAPRKPHSITSSARAKTDAGMSKPSARAAFRFIVILNPVEICTGSSLTLVPSRMR
jgi:hypothetical protein